MPHCPRLRTTDINNCPFLPNAWKRQRVLVHTGLLTSTFCFQEICLHHTPVTHFVFKTLFHKRKPMQHHKTLSVINSLCLASSRLRDTLKNAFLIKTLLQALTCMFQQCRSWCEQLESTEDAQQPSCVCWCVWVNSAVEFGGRAERCSCTRGDRYAA